jgi:tripartite-type tricarboxylate transporter receptor subunit TctC
MRFTMTTLYAALHATVLAALTGAAFAQESADAYPSRPVTVINPLAPGGSGDVETRLYNQKLTEALGKPFIIDFKPGAGTTLGTGMVAKAKPDGYTLLSVSPSLTIAPAFYKDLPYDVNRDLSPISQMSKRATMVVAHPAVPYKNMKELVAYMKANPGDLNWGTNGPGSISHLLGEWLQTLTGTKMTFVHYKGVGGLTTDVLGGRIGATVFTFTSALQLVKTDKLKILGMSTTTRSPAMPDVPTVQEQGIRDFEYPSWLGYFGPPGMAPALVNKLNAELVKAARSPEVVKTMAADYTTLVAGSPGDLKKLVATETARWQKLVSQAGIKLE